MKNKQLESAVFGKGCFWCMEAVFQQVEGVREVVSGYAGGSVKSPTYEQVCTGKTNHAEVVKVIYDPQQVSYEELLNIFWKAHDPTQLNRQGVDVGSQYRSIILYKDQKQQRLAEEYEEDVVTQIVPLVKFYPAENYHQDYFKKNPKKAYCQAVIVPKLKKLSTYVP